MFKTPESETPMIPDLTNYSAPAMFKTLPMIPTDDASGEYGQQRQQQTEYMQQQRPSLQQQQQPLPPTSGADRSQLIYDTNEGSIMVPGVWANTWAGLHAQDAALNLHHNHLLHHHHHHHPLDHQHHEMSGVGDPSPSAMTMINSPSERTTSGDSGSSGRAQTLVTSCCSGTASLSSTDSASRPVMKNLHAHHRGMSTPPTLPPANQSGQCGMSLLDNQCISIIIITPITLTLAISWASLKNCPIFSLFFMTYRTYIKCNAAMADYFI